MLCLAVVETVVRSVLTSRGVLPTARLRSSGDSSGDKVDDDSPVVSGGAGALEEPITGRAATLSSIVFSNSAAVGCLLEVINRRNPDSVNTVNTCTHPLPFLRLHITGMHAFSSAVNCFMAFATLPLREVIS